jgi:hypothetical protein
MGKRLAGAEKEVKARQQQAETWREFFSPDSALLCSLSGAR